MPKIIPLAKPLCRTYPHTAHALSILQNRPEIYPWLLNSFIQIEGWECENMDFEDFWILECPLLSHQRIGKDFLREHGITIPDFIKDSIDHGNCVYLVVNTDVIAAYGAADYPHDALIHGYDEEKRIYYVADFFNGSRYGTREVPYEEIGHALTLSKEAENHWIFRKDIILLRNNGAMGKFSPERVKQSLDAYIKGEPTRYWYHRSQACYVRHPYELVYGMDTYRTLYAHLNAAKGGRVLEHWRQVFHFFYEHKKTMFARLCYMEQNGYMVHGERFAEAYMDIKEKAHFIREQFLHFHDGSAYDFEKAEKFVEGIEQAEGILLPEIRDSILTDSDDRSCGLVFFPESV